MPATASHVYPSETPQFARHASRRSVVHSTKGIVSCSQPLAARAGIRILEQGGNAADAAVAVAAALNMTEPTSTGIGGDMFCLYYDAATKKTLALNGSGRSGKDTSLEQVRREIGLPVGQSAEIPRGSVHSVTVPGAAAGWVDTVEKLGSGKVSLAQVLQPAVDLGEEGFPVHHLCATMWGEGEQDLRDASPNFLEMLKADPAAKDGCRAPKSGELFWNKNLAKTFRLLAEHGKKGFYEGEVADAYIKVVRDRGGHLTHNDLQYHAKFGTEQVDPISLRFDGQGIDDPIDLWEHPPNGQGLIALITLGLFQSLERASKIPRFSPADHNSVTYLHALIESLRLAFSDGTHYISDPNVVPVPVSGLLSPSHLTARVQHFSPTAAAPASSINPSDLNPQHQNPAMSSSDTVYLTITDPHGNAASFINSNYAGFGSAIIPAGCGFTLQNRGSNFYIGDGTPATSSHANVYAPRKRPYHTIIPAMVTHASTGELHTTFGVMGAFMQPQGHVQVLLNMLVFGMNPQEALDAPRICYESASVGEDRAINGAEVVYAEEGVAEETVEGLRRLGHDVRVVAGYGRAKFGRGQVVRRYVEGGRTVWGAGSDCRGDGAAFPL
ncbi:MAG: hypothetical protein M1831_004030 [Alyxoria varia]|nr:MAG: hypothetical protein M1831_004030 [Alyxoria varia]